MSRKEKERTKRELQKIEKKRLDRSLETVQHLIST